MRSKPRGIRNNNPGNLRLPPSTTRPGYVGSDKDGFSVFNTPEAGLESLARLLVNYGKSGFDTVAKIISRYAPAVENNTTVYASFVASKLHFDVDAVLDMKSPYVIADLMHGIIKFENGQCPYTMTAIFNAAEKAVNPGGRK